MCPYWTCFGAIWTCFKFALTDLEKNVYNKGGKWLSPLLSQKVTLLYFCQEKNWQEINSDLNPTEQLGVFENLVKNKHRCNPTPKMCKG